MCENIWKNCKHVIDCVMRSHRVHIERTALQEITTIWNLLQFRSCGIDLEGPLRYIRIMNKWLTFAWVWISCKYELSFTSGSYIDRAATLLATWKRANCSRSEQCDVTVPHRSICFNHLSFASIVKTNILSFIAKADIRNVSRVMIMRITN